jgi:serine/threonine protein kinase
LSKWFLQLTRAVYTLSLHGIWHGDIKPDNIVVDDTEDLVLVDFAQAFATSATASPEVRKWLQEHAFDATGGYGVPPEWPLSKIVASEVYSIGRTMFLVAEGISMIKIYDNFGWINHELPFHTEFAEDSVMPPSLQDLVLQCVVANPESRITLQNLIECLEMEDTGSQKPNLSTVLIPPC